MMTPKIKIKKWFPDSIVPSRAHPTDSGLDLFAYKFEKIFAVDDGKEFEKDINVDFAPIILKPGERALINTGISATVGPGFEIQIRPRSGNALKRGLTVLNAPGTVDESYRNCFGVIIINLSQMNQSISKGDKIAQMVVSPVVLSEVEIVEDLNITDRNLNGFGSTGN